MRRRIERLSARQKVAQLLLVGYAGPDPGASVPRDLRRLGPGGIVIAGPNYAGADALRDVAGGLRASAGGDRIPPFVMTIQEGGELNSFPDLPPAEAPADLPSVREAARQSRLSARTLRSLGLTGVLGPVVDVGLESGSALGVRLYSDDPEEVARYAASAVRAYESERMFSAVKHLPGLGAADRSPQEGPASVGLGLPELRERDLIPFRAAIDAGVPGVVLSNALYPFSDFTVPASLSPAVADELLRDELGFEGVAITDDLSDPSVTVLTTVPDAAVEAVRAGADMAFVSGPAADQAAAHAALLSAVAQRTHLAEPGSTARSSASSWPSGVTACCGSNRLERLRLHAVVVEHRCVALLGQDLGGGGLSASPAPVVAVPPAHRGHQHSGAGIVGYACRAGERAALVPDADLCPVGDSAGLGVGRVDNQLGLGLGGELAALVGEARVQEQMRLRGDQRQREALVERGVEHLGRRHELRSQRDLARLGAEASLGVRDRPLTEIDLGPAAFTQAVFLEALEELVDQLLVAVCEAGIVEPEARREQTKGLGVRLGLTERLDGRPAEGQIVVAPGEDHVQVLELRGGREHDVRVTSRVGHELLEHHGEQVVASQALAAPAPGRAR